MPPGNCWASCIASILEVQLTDLPDEASCFKPGMRHYESWQPYYKMVTSYLRSNGIILVEVACEHLRYNDYFNDLFVILTGQSPRNKNILHAVVGQGFKIVHDPHPDRSGLVGDFEKWGCELLVKMP
jgi:hypothetical protein